MSRRVFLDIGAHLGETLDVVQMPRWGFDEIYCFEPAPPCWAALEEKADERTHILRYGLWSQRATLELHDPGDVGASIHAAKALTTTSVDVELRDAAAWFVDNLSFDDRVIAKINCEGAECELLDRLIASGEIRKITHMVVHFDVRKVPGQGHREAVTRGALDAAHVNYRSADEIFFGRNVSDKTRHWLEWNSSSAFGRLRHVPLRKVEFAARTRVYRVRRAIRKSRSRSG